jgi:hypothetical protein
LLCVTCQPQFALTIHDLRFTALHCPRLRENIKALTSTAEAKQLIARYVSKANEQETRLEQLEAERRTSIADRTRIQSELDLAIRTPLRPQA